MFPKPGRISLCWSCFILVVSLSEDAAGLRWAQARTVSPVWQMPYACRCCQKRWGFICAWAAAGLQEREPGKIRNCEVRHVSLHPAPSLGTNTVQISNVRRRDTSQIVLRFQELIMFSREQSCSPSSAVGRATAASSCCRQPSDFLGSQKKPTKHRAPLERLL